MSVRVKSAKSQTSTNVMRQPPDDTEPNETRWCPEMSNWSQERTAQSKPPPIVRDQRSRIIAHRYILTSRSGPAGRNDEVSRRPYLEHDCLDVLGAPIGGAMHAAGIALGLSLDARLVDVAGSNTDCARAYSNRLNGDRELSHVRQTLSLRGRYRRPVRLRRDRAGSGSRRSLGRDDRCTRPAAPPPSAGRPTPRVPRATGAQRGGCHRSGFGRVRAPRQVGS
jgi:hypothetical protein